MRRLYLPIITLLVLGALWWSKRSETRALPLPVEAPPRPVPAERRAGPTAPPEPPQLRAAPAIDPVNYPLSAALNAPDSNIRGDLEALSQILEAWRTNFPHEGNPVGENHEIGAALSGANALELVLIPKTHRAFNLRGELCDRWGTPFRFHQISGQKMEIISAGPDRKFGTEDDAQWSPP